MVRGEPRGAETVPRKVGRPSADSGGTNLK